MNEKIYLWSDPAVTTLADRPSITAFLLNDGKEHAAVLVIPGGGYGCVCEPSEGTPTARRFNELGLHAFVLDYRVAPNRYPAPQLDAMRAMKIIRGRAAEWKIRQGGIIACGFSAGGHLAASLGTICRELKTDNGDKFDAVSSRPDYLFLAYGVLKFAPWSEKGTQENLLSKDASSELIQKTSPADNVGPDTPPAFLFHTFRDQIVDYRNSICFAEAMYAAGLPCELRLFPYGDHGMLLGIDTLDVVTWTQAAIDFVQTVELDPAFRKGIYTNRYQCVKNGCN